MGKLQKYFRNFRIYDTSSINEFMKGMKARNIKSIDVILEGVYTSQAISKNKLNKEYNHEAAQNGNLEKSVSTPDNTANIVKRKSGRSGEVPVEIRITYKANPGVYTTLGLRFVKTYHNQYDALRCTNNKIEWLKEKIPNANITIKNNWGQNVEKTYSLMLEVAQREIKENKYTATGNV